MSSQQYSLQRPYIVNLLRALTFENLFEGKADDTLGVAQGLVSQKEALCEFI
jgi:hypothetical protein